MNLSDDDIMKLAGDVLTAENGQDFHSYDFEPHWWGDIDEILKFARALSATPDAQREQDRLVLDRLQQIIACAYQIAGMHDADANILDVLANPLDATQEQIDALLPYQPFIHGGDPVQDRLDAERYRAIRLRHGFILYARCVDPDNGTFSSETSRARIDEWADTAVKQVSDWAAKTQQEKDEWMLAAHDVAAIAQAKEPKP